MGPGAVWYGKCLQEALWGLVRDLALGADRASSHETSNVLPHPQPPELALDKCEGTVINWVTGELRGVVPLEYLSAGLPRNELSPVRKSIGGCLGTSLLP